MMLNSLALLDLLRTVLPNSKEFYPLHEPKFERKTADEVKSCVESGWVSSSGVNINRLEQLCSEILNKTHCIAVSSGTAALHLSYIALDIPPNSEVFCPGISFVATANTIRYIGAQPYFIDVDRLSLCMSADSLEIEISKNCEVIKDQLVNKVTGKIISAIVIVNTFGNSPNLVKINKIAKMYNLKLIEDAAGALGSRYMNSTPGELSDIATYSFNGNKIITGGSGGLVVTKNDNICRKIKHLSTTAKLVHPWEYNHDVVGYNYRMPNLNATLILSQLKHFEKILRKKRDLHSIYSELFTNLPVRVLSEPRDSFSNYWLICLDLMADDINLRNTILETLNKNNIMSRPLWTPLYKLESFKCNPRSDMRNCENAFINVINLPSSPHLI